jgi:hypothetical protein
MSSPRSFKQDYQVGITVESELKPILEYKFNDKFIKTGRYDKLDYEGERCFVEIKSRTNRYDQYPTTMIQQSKFDFARKQTKPVYFVFAYTDGTYYIQYNSEVFDKFESGYFQRPGRIDKIDKRQVYVYIPITSLTRV